MSTSAAIKAVATAAAHATCRTCSICGQEFMPLSRKSKGRLCQKPACRSEIGRRNGGSRGEPRPSGERIAPLERPYRTILQPAMSAYLASLASTPAHP